MRIAIIGKGLTLTDAQRAHIEKKVAKLDRFFNDDVECTLRVRKERGNEIVELTVPLKGGEYLRAQENSQEMYASLDSVMEKIMRQIRKHRTRLEKRVREGAYVKAEMEDALTAIEDESSGRLVRTKVFKMGAMSVEEAISQMEMLGHSFFLFKDVQTQNVCVVYARDDGNYGLLMPEE